jgi:hypothetical protein
MSESIAANGSVPEENSGARIIGAGAGRGNGFVRNSAHEENHCVARSVRLGFVSDCADFVLPDISEHVRAGISEEVRDDARDDIREEVR